MEKQRQEVKDEIITLDKSCSYEIELAFDKDGELCGKKKLELSGTHIGAIITAAQLHMIIVTSVFKTILERAKKDHGCKARWLAVFDAVRLAEVESTDSFYKGLIKELEGVEVNEEETAPQEVAQENQE